ncbi:Uncharacterized protein OBRU01_13124 [Operophtera brumata]|uniref:Uncharacterized protein n=1 Tax=Operophtera brumata TaxID=104452 RepID=A0A0L7L967_OPEBR|nr:Uncharacterized protein OBRU01_13124 [Operophtera brumata]
MLFILILWILTNIAYTASGNAGSTIFYNRHGGTECWNEDDIVKLRARQVFEEVLSAQIHPDEINGKYLRDMLRYYRTTLHSVQTDDDPHLATLLKEAIADTIGAHLRNEVLPIARYAFYAGYVPYKSAKQIHDFFDEIKYLLNTQGLGWRQPELAPQWSNITVAKILIGTNSFFDPCTCLVTKRDSNSCIHLPTPRLDDGVKPSAIALPFKTGGLLSLTSPNSDNALLKYYTTAARCILSSSPENCRHSDFLSFNNELWNWMKQDVAPHLADEKLYTAYGGVLRIAAAVQSYGKGLSRRNLFEDLDDAYLTKWRPWESLTQPYIYINADLSPKIYIGAVIAVAVAIYLIIILFNYLCVSNPCRCKERSVPGASTFSKEVAYAKVESSIPAMLPHQSTIYYSDKKRSKRTPSKTKSASLGSIRTQKVHDMNENAEKLMEIIMSGNEENAVESSLSESDECENVIETMRPNSPPKIDTSISQIRIQRNTGQQSKKPMFTTSSVTHDTYGVDQKASDSVWSESESSTSQSVSSTSSKTSKSCSSRDLAWARRVISQHTSSSKTYTSRTELDQNSFTTPPSQR